MLIILLLFKPILVPLVLHQTAKASKMVRWRKKLPESKEKGSGPSTAYAGKMAP